MLRQPMRWTLAVRLLMRALLLSFAKMQPVFCMRAERYVTLPPGALAMSRMRSWGCGASAMHGRKDETACSM